MAMLGRLGKEAVAAVGLSMQPFRLIQATFMGLSVGTTALVARATGAGEPGRGRSGGRGSPSSSPCFSGWP